MYIRLAKSLLILIKMLSTSIIDLGENRTREKKEKLKNGRILGTRRRDVKTK